MQISIFIKVLIFNILTEIRPAIVNFKNYEFVCPNKLFKLKLTLKQVYAINLSIHHSFTMLR